MGEIKRNKANKKKKIDNLKTNESVRKKEGKRMDELKRDNANQQLKK